MPRDALEFRIVIASPSDVFETRKFVFEAVHEIDRTFEAQNVTIRALGWEEYASPGIASEPQEVIHQQILKEYDILIAIFGTRLGSPTNSQLSGTVAEIEHAIAKNDSHMGLFRVQIYFCDRIESISNTSIDELMRLNEYRKSLGDRGVLYRTFSTGAELQREVRVNVQRPIADYLQNLGRAIGSVPKAALAAPLIEPRGASQSVSEDLGFLDHQGRAELAASAGNASIQAMSALLLEINAETARNVAEIDGWSSPAISVVDKKTLVNSFANFLKFKSSRLKQEALTAKTSFIDFFDAMAFVIEMQREYADPGKYKADLVAFFKHAEFAVTIIPRTRESVSSFKKMVESLPRITVQFNQAKRFLIDALEYCMQAFDEIERALADLVAKTDANQLT
jgi:hypothetical protein